MVTQYILLVCSLQMSDTGTRTIDSTLKIMAGHWTMSSQDDNLSKQTFRPLAMMFWTCDNRYDNWQLV